MYAGRLQDIDKLLTDRDIVLKEIQERDRTIGDKEQRVYELKKQNQELEKFKFVLDHKIRELKATIDPKDKNIAEMQRQIQAMDAELVDYHRQNKLSSLELGQLKLKQRALQDEIVDQRQQLAIGEHQMKRLKNDLYECVQHIQDPKKLKSSITLLYQKYITNEVSKADVDLDILKEQNRQRDYLEKSVESLKRRLAKDSEVHRQDNIKIMQENASLICEINDLRREVNLLRLERQEARVQGTARCGSQTNKKTRDSSDASRDRRKSAEMQTLLESQKEQIVMLTAQVEELQNKLQKGCQTARRSPPPHRVSKLEKVPLSYSNRTIGNPRLDAGPASPASSRTKNDNTKDKPLEKKEASGTKNADGELAPSAAGSSRKSSAGPGAARTKAAGENQGISKAGDGLTPSEKEAASEGKGYGDGTEFSKAPSAVDSDPAGRNEEPALQTSVAEFPERGKSQNIVPAVSPEVDGEENVESYPADFVEADWTAPADSVESQGHPAPECAPELVQEKEAELSGD